MLMLENQRAPLAAMRTTTATTTRRMLTPAAFQATQVAQATQASQPSVGSRKRKQVATPCGAGTEDKRARRGGAELEYEEMLQEAALLREELELLVMVAAELCIDLACDAAPARSFAALLARHESLLAAAQDVTTRQVREMAQQMGAMMQYLCRAHYAHFALVDMQEQLKDCRNRFMRFACQYAAVIGL